QPGFAENTHRTNAADGTVTATRSLGASRLSVGASGGADWVRSSNLGDRNYRRGGAFVEWRGAIAPSASMQLGLRADDYSSFGSSVNPSVSIAARPSATLKLRASAARAFRIPTFTELYYHDPANLGSPDLRPEHGWSVDGGADWTRAGVTMSVTPFR